MKSTTLNINSWHYKLASNFGYDPDFKDHDICTYTRRVMLGLVLSAFALVIALGIVFVIATTLVHMVLGPFFYFMYGLIPEPLFFIGWGIVASAAILFVAMAGTTYLKNLYNKRRDARREKLRELELQDDVDYSPSFLEKAYDAYKNKFCMRLDFVDKEGNAYETERQRIYREEREEYKRHKEESERLARETQALEVPTTTGSAP